MIGFISTLVAILLITLNIELSLIYTIYSSPFSVFTSRLLATDLNAETSASNHYEVFLLFCLQLFYTSLSWSVLNLSSHFTKDTLHSRPCTLYCWTITGVFSNPSYNRSSLYWPCTDNTENTVPLLLSADQTENKPRGNYLASPLARWLLPSNEL
jgi:hypothetical protein